MLATDANAATVSSSQVSDSFWRSVTVILTGTVIGQVIGIVTLPIISRLYEPQAFGQYALLASASALLSVVVTLGLSSAVMAPEEDGAAEEVVMVAFACAVILATVLFCIAVALGQALPLPTTGIPPWQFCLWAYAMTIVSCLAALLRVYTNRRGFNKALAVNSIVSAVCTLIFAIPIGLLHHGSLGLIVAGLAAGLLSSLQMLRHTNPFKHRLSWAKISSTLRKYRGYVSYQYSANLMESAGAQLPTQVLAGFYGSAPLGLYSMNERLLGIPLRLVGTPLSTVYFRNISKSFRSGNSVAPLTFSIVSKVMTASTAPMIVLILWGPGLFGWALGQEWREAGALCAYLVPLYVLTLCRASVSNCRVVIGRQRANAGLSAVRLGIVIICLVGGHAWFGSLTGTVFALAVGSSLFMLIDMAVNFVLLHSHLKKYLLLALGFVVIVLTLWHQSGALDALAA